jgi:hypothetical protein
MNELDHIVKAPGYRRAGNHGCWALCTKQGNGRWHVRRIVWGMTMARAEKRPGETIRRAAILLRDEK